jgi:N-acetylglucosamine kinase-like BadF-type ATPase
MIIVADSGSTKTTWCLCETESRQTRFVQTAGINPYYQGEKEIYSTLEKEFTSVPGVVNSVYFYGAGCANSSVNAIVYNVLSNYFGVTRVEVESDLMAAARSLCGHGPGIACILGTGSNSCYYDGKSIVHHVSPLGFILGDEGSGGVLGRKLLSDILKNQLPSSLAEKFYSRYQTNVAEILENIYRKPFPNRYSAQFTRFIYENIEETALSDLVLNEFQRFFSRNVMQYPQSQKCEIHFSGSIAFYFPELLKKAAASLGVRVGKIVKEPMDGLIDFHLGDRLAIHEIN